MLTTVIQGLGQIVEASFVTQVQKDRIAAPGACRLGGGCRVGVRVMSVDAIVETLDEMESKASGSLSDVRKAEQGGQQDHAMLKQTCRCL